MKKFIVSIIMFLCLTLNVIALKPAFAISNTFKEGIYKVSDFNPSQNSIYIFSNVSATDNIYMIIMNQNQTMLHAILLLPNSEKHITVPILTDYKVILVGKGEMYFSPQVPKQ